MLKDRAAMESTDLIRDSFCYDSWLQKISLCDSPNLLTPILINSGRTGVLGSIDDGDPEGAALRHESSAAPSRT
jgi:hypothetical protein